MLSVLPPPAESWPAEQRVEAFDLKNQLTALHLQHRSHVHTPESLATPPMIEIPQAGWSSGTPILSSTPAPHCLLPQPIAPIHFKASIYAPISVPQQQYLQMLGCVGVLAQRSPAAESLMSASPPNVCLQQGHEQLLSNSVTPASYLSPAMQGSPPMFLNSSLGSSASSSPQRISPDIHSPAVAVPPSATFNLDYNTWHAAIELSDTHQEIERRVSCYKSRNVSGAPNVDISWKMEIVWNEEFERLFSKLRIQLGHNWELRPVSTGAEQFASPQWIAFEDTAKVRFGCVNASCLHGWTAKWGRIKFFIRLNQDPTGHTNGVVYFKLMGDKCKNCYSNETLHPWWYPRGVAEVIANLYNAVLYRCYGLPQKPDFRKQISTA